ncbi:phosphatidate phosphatase LPIN3-like isoform X1 [Mya arenaria]|uniref:phosphatidate phosphatase LPIN3-like isoform X1 n=1 Tax=Mya arenaria TaxID=6604 RepID=UPI0022DF30A6|nr:phosphatidate phosphatase LPIN3-like isoform X1 [Mya arenaria]XP_052763664.1 phosphatidate phosphatase LPIN3-like isoform X1 [Mya arenaria]XP_052763665.1 phosphatidate phosphatase LPIN3-like isoform X1 [Mya arenaria]XP_052763666.1 phosphatidate phosphatase LPIN3-like isoform X1 [Mya arenaria]
MSYFSYVGKLFSNVKGFYQEINAATLTGAIDTLIVEQENGSYKSSPFHVRFGKLGVLRSREKVVDIEVNGETIDVQMKLGDTGEAFFVEELEDDTEELPEYLATSPFPSDSDLMEQGVRQLKEQAAMIKTQTGVEGQGLEVTTFTEVKVTENQVNIQVDIEAVGNDSGINVTVSSDSNKGVGVIGREHLDSVRSEHSRDADVDIRVENEQGELVKGRRKRRRKRRNKLNSNKQETSTSNAPPHVEDDFENEEIFDMEGFSTDEELSRLTSNMSSGSLSKSISLPVVEENKFDRTHEWASAHEGFQYLNNHPFSDTDLSPLASPINSRPHTPKSDTEVDRQKSLEQQDRLIVGAEDDTLWEWGDMPRKTSPTINEEDSELSPRTAGRGLKNDKNKQSGGLFHFMRKTKNVRHKPEAEGIYLDDLNLNNMDEETAKLYFPKRFSNSHFKSIEKEKDEDVESGRGASLPQSPHSVEGAVGGPAGNHILPSEIRSLGPYSLSLCGGLADHEPMSLTKFMSKIVTFEDLCDNPAMLSYPDLVVKIEDQYYNWQTAAPLIMAKIVFQKNMPDAPLKSLVIQHMPKKKEKKGYSWFSWSRPKTEPVTSASHSSSSITMTSIEADVLEHKPIMSQAQMGEPASLVGDTLTSSPKSSVTESPKKMKDIDRLTVIGCDHSSSEGDTEGSDRTNEPKKNKRLTRKKIYRRTLRLSSDQIRQLNLKPGQNEVTYSVTTQFQGTKRCTSNIYLWRWDDKLIVSDIDGTITKSDVLGQILPVVGRDWSQSGVAQLYSRIAGNGYKFLYLSARAIGQSKLTKDLLQNIKQGEMTLPPGPLLLSPTSLISAFHKEVIERKPEEFKISCLSDIGSLFPANTRPFYAGFGNKVNDVIAYKEIKIPIFRIFTINPSGELKHELSLTFQTSYTKLTDVADHFFPPIHKLPGNRASEYNEVNYWREPLPELSPIEADIVTIGDETRTPTTETAATHS